MSFLFHGLVVPSLGSSCTAGFAEHMVAHAAQPALIVGPSRETGDQRGSCRFKDASGLSLGEGHAEDELGGGGVCSPFQRSPCRGSLNAAAARIYQRFGIRPGDSRLRVSPPPRPLPPALRPSETQVGDLGAHVFKLYFTQPSGESLDENNAFSRGEGGNTWSFVPSGSPRHRRMQSATVCRGLWHVELG